MPTPHFRLKATVLDAADPARLARFYQGLLGWSVADDDPTWVTLRDAAGGAGLSFQREPLHVAPSWPAREDDVQMQMHLDVGVDDLAAAVDRATDLGARLADFQPQDEVRVMLDPEGHPFCLFLPGQ